MKLLKILLLICSIIIQTHASKLLYKSTDGMMICDGSTIAHWSILDITEDYELLMTVYDMNDKNGVECKYVKITDGTLGEIETIVTADKGFGNDGILIAGGVFVDSGTLMLGCHNGSDYTISAFKKNGSTWGSTRNDSEPNGCLLDRRFPIRSSREKSNFVIYAREKSCDITSGLNNYVHARDLIIIKTQY